MPQRIETITQHIFAFDDDEITRILNALSDFGDDEMVDAIYKELPYNPSNEDCCAERALEGDIDNSLAILKFDIDTSGLSKAADEFERLATAAERVSDSLAGPVGYFGVGDICEIRIGDTK